MAELEIGSTIKLKNNNDAKIIKVLGKGGQGIVYQVEWNGANYALKWYTQDFFDENIFYKNLEINIGDKAPSDEFLWPLMLTERQQGSFGYIMKLRPDGYNDFSDFLLAKINFSSISAIITAALKICKGFKALHIRGLSYQDLNDGNFFINSITGDVFICDNDNVAPHGQSTGMKGKMRYMAPEIVAGGTPGIYSDYYSLSVILFMLFYGSHPLEGTKVVRCPCMTEDNERKYFGSSALFIYDKDNEENRPVRGVHSNAIKRWPLFSEILRKSFVDAFSQNRIKNPDKRMMPSDWERILVQLRNMLTLCTSCGDDFFISENDTECIHCSNSNVLQFRLISKNHGNIVLTPRKEIYLGTSNFPVAVVKTNKKDPSILGLMNISSSEWIVETPSGKTKEVKVNEVMPTKVGLKIKFNQSELCEISN